MTRYRVTLGDPNHDYGADFRVWFWVIFTACLIGFALRALFHAIFG